MGRVGCVMTTKQKIAFGWLVLMGVTIMGLLGIYAPIWLGVFLFAVLTTWSIHEVVGWMVDRELENALQERRKLRGVK